MAKPRWTPDRHTTIGRLAFLAAEDEMRRRSRPRLYLLWRVLDAGGASPRGAIVGRGTGASSRVGRDAAATSFARWVIACDEVAEQLNPLEQELLRMTGEVPHWFLDRVDSTARDARRS